MLVILGGSILLGFTEEEGCNTRRSQTVLERMIAIRNTLLQVRLRLALCNLSPFL